MEETKLNVSFLNYAANESFEWLNLHFLALSLSLKFVMPRDYFNWITSLQLFQITMRKYVSVDDLLIDHEKLCCIRKMYCWWFLCNQIFCVMVIYQRPNGGIAQLATKGDLGEVGTTCKRGLEFESLCGGFPSRRESGGFCPIEVFKACRDYLLGKHGGLWNRIPS